MKPVRGLLIAPVAFGVMAGTATTAIAADAYFSRIATLPVYTSLPRGTDSATETVAEIVAATKDGMTLVHTDSPGEAVVFVDAADPAQPRPLGRVALGGEPTSVAVVGGMALVGVNTSENHGQPSGHVAVIDVQSRTMIARCDVSGQPDSVAASPDGKYLAVAVENERDEDANDGALPQMPAGHLSILDLGADGQPDCRAVRTVALTGLADVAPEDPEPEFVSINDANIAVVTMQENNHLALVDLTSGKVVGDFSAGAASLSAVPTDKKKLVNGTGSLTDVPREPDAVAWLDGDRFITANEGDWKGGSRGFTVWSAKGDVLYDSAAVMEHLGMAHGHYPAKRAAKKGVEPEGVAAGTYDGTPLFFVNSERGNFVAVFEDKGTAAAPEFVQILPTGVGPEGLLAIPQRNLFVVATEEDSAEDGVRATLGIYRRGPAALPAYPSLVSVTDATTGAPIGWGAQSGLAADSADPARLYSVSDSFYDSARIFTIDAAGMPARIVKAVDITGARQEKLDLEGIAINGSGGFWAVSEGNPDKGLANLLLWVNEDGSVEREIPLPESVAAAAGRFGFEGVAEYKDDGVTRVIVAVQREWKDDPKGLVKLAIYTPARDSWSFVHYPLDKPASPAGGWVGLSEITALGGKEFAVVERDNKGGPDAALKNVYRISLDGIEPAAAGAELPVVNKSKMLDLLPSMQAGAGWTLDKVEGFAVTADGQMVAVTDNDGVDDATGETRYLRLGPVTTAATN